MYVVMYNRQHEMDKGTCTVRVLLFKYHSGYFNSVYPLRVILWQYLLLYIRAVEYRHIHQRLTMHVIQRNMYFCA